MRPVILLVIVFLFSAPAFAQENPLPTECTASTVTQLLSDVQEAVGTSLPTVEVDPQAAVAALNTLTSQIAAMQALCAELVFSGDGSTVVGPISVPDGIYRAIVVTDNIGVVTSEALNGVCGDEFIPFNAFITTAGEGSETIFTSQDCEMLVQMDISGVWELRFERVR